MLAGRTMHARTHLVGAFRPYASSSAVASAMVALSYCGASVALAEPAHDAAAAAAAAAADAAASLAASTAALKRPPPVPASVIRRVLRVCRRILRLLRRTITLTALGAPLLVLFPLQSWLSPGASASVSSSSSSSNASSSGKAAEATRKEGSPVLWLEEEGEGGGGGAAGGMNFMEADAHWSERLLWRYLHWSIGAAGPTCIKLAQWASSRDDLLSPELCARLSQLQSQTPPHAWADTEGALRRCFGDEWARRLVIEKQEPIGSGCVAQVYRGRVVVDDGNAGSACGGGGGGSEEGKAGGKPSLGAEVAVKVLHPQVEEAVLGDLELLRVIARLVEKWAPHLKVLSPLKVSGLCVQVNHLITRTKSNRWGKTDHTPTLTE